MSRRKGIHRRRDKRRRHKAMKLKAAEAFKEGLVQKKIEEQKTPEEEIIHP